MCSASGVLAQEPPPPPPSTAVVDGVPLGSTLSADLFNVLPAGDSVFSLLETSQAEMISDRISGAGLGFGAPARFSTFGGSSTETRFRVGDVDITDPSTGGRPLALSELFWWQRVSVATGLRPADINTTGSVVTLDPRRPATSWTSVVEGSSSFGDALTAAPSASVAPPIARLTGWNRGSVIASGPLGAASGPFGSGRAGLVFAGAWTAASERNRGGLVSADADVASAFAHLVVAATEKNEVRTIAWVQRALFPAANRAMYADPQARLADISTHLQSTWAHDDQAGARWRLFAGYTRRRRTPQSALLTAATIERLEAGPVPEQVADTGARTDRRLSAGARIARTAGAESRHQLQGGVDVDAARSTSDPGFNGVIAELVDGLPSRLWQYTAPAQTSSRHSRTISAFAGDRLSVGGRGTLDVALRYESLVAAADGAAQGVNWSTWLPQASLRWPVNAKHAVGIFGGFERSAYQLPLNNLAWGDPASVRADAFRWTGGSTGATLAASARLFSAGPGGIGRIDPSLERPYSDDMVVGIEARPLAGLRLQLAGVGKWEKQLLGLVNQSRLTPVYSIVNIADLGLDLVHADDDQVLPVGNLVLPAASYRFDDLLVNAPDLTARRLGVKLTTEVTAGHLYILLAGTAYRAEGGASHQGFHGTENDQGLLGDALLDPNAALYSRGRLFGDRAFTAKMTTVYRFPSNVTLGAIARYQDGQPFARLVVVPGLNQGAALVRAFPNGGSRFTFTGTLDVRLQKEFAAAGRRVAIVVDGYNLINLAEEVEERVVTGPAFRTPTAIQPPRTIRVGARLTF